MPRQNQSRYWNKIKFAERGNSEDGSKSIDRAIGNEQQNKYAERGRFKESTIYRGTSH